MPRSEDADTIVAECTDTQRIGAKNAPAAVQAMAAVEPPVAASFEEAVQGDRIGKPFKIGAVMFRLLKSYGITDEEIAEGVASYHAKRRNNVLA